MLFGETMSNDITKLLGICGSLFFCLLGFGAVGLAIAIVDTNGLWLFIMTILGGLGVGILGVVMLVKVIRY
jgi:hypothetical protein